MRFPCLCSGFELFVGDHMRGWTRPYACMVAYVRADGRRQTHANTAANLRKDKQYCKPFPLILCVVAPLDIGILMWYLCVRIEGCTLAKSFYRSLWNIGSDIHSSATSLMLGID